MSLSQEQAAAALEDIRQTGTRSASLYSYQRFARYLYLWGVIWVLGYALTFFFPKHGDLTWGLLVAAGLAAGLALGRGAAGRIGWRYGASMATVLGFIFATLAILPPARGIQLSAFIPLVIAHMFVLQGIWNGRPRYVAVGVAVAALTLAGFFLIPHYFLLWMASVGGCALVLAGLMVERA